MFLLHLHQRLRMGIAVTFCAEAQQKGSHDKKDDAFLFRSENEPVSQLLPLPTFGDFQSISCFTRGRTRTDG
jgi:hypothetical protein